MDSRRRALKESGIVAQDPVISRFLNKEVCMVCRLSGGLINGIAPPAGSSKEDGYVGSTPVVLTLQFSILTNTRLF